MSKLIALFALLALTGLVIGACGDDDKDDCEQAADLRDDVWDSYCSGKSSECWACDCHNQGLVAVPTGGGTEFTCEQPDPLPSCDGSTLEEAQTCLADKAACEQGALARATNSCNTSQK
jgi:hypothetical protein